MKMKKIGPRGPRRRALPKSDTDQEAQMDHNQIITSFEQLVMNILFFRVVKLLKICFQRQHPINDNLIWHAH